MSEKRRRAPAGLGADGRRLWRDVVASYDLNASELIALEASCRSLDEVRRLEAALAEAPATVEGSRGQTRTHPLFAEVRAHRDAFLKLFAGVGLPEEAGRRADAKATAGRRLALLRHHGAA